MTRRKLVSIISDLVDQFFPKGERLHQGQMPWVATHKNDRLRYGQAISESQVTHVYLTPTPASEIIDRAKGKKLRDIKIERAASLCLEAYEQDAVLTNAEIAVMLKTTPSTISKYIRIWEEENGRLLPRRGTIHDLGPTLTHKKEICHAMFFKGKTVSEIMREHYHSAQAIHRYINTFKRILICRKKGFDQEQACYTVHISKRLCAEYYDLMDAFAEDNITLDQLINTPIISKREEIAQNRLKDLPPTGLANEPEEVP